MPELSDDYVPSVYVPVVHDMGLYHCLWTNVLIDKRPKFGLSKRVEECTPDELTDVMIFQFNAVADASKPYLDKECKHINKLQYIGSDDQKHDVILTIRANPLFSPKSNRSVFTKTLNGITGRALSAQEGGTLSIARLFKAGNPYHPVDLLLAIEEKNGEKQNAVTAIQRPTVFMGKAISPIDVTPFLLDRKLVQTIHEEEIKDAFEDN